MPQQPPDRARSNRATLWVMVGLPGAGKTVRARELEAEHRALRLTPDEWMIPLFGDSDAGGKRDVLEGRFVWLALRALRLRVDVVLDFGFWGRDERSALRALAADVGADCVLVYLPVDPEEQRRRIEARLADAPESTFELGPDELAQFRTVFCEPDHDELTSTRVDQPPDGYPSWTAWSAERWPSSM